MRILICDDEQQYLDILSAHVSEYMRNRYSNLFTNENYDALCEKLPPLFFYPVHKSYFVNLHYVQKYSYSELILINSDRVPIAPRKQSAFHKFWFEYLRRR